MASYIGTDIKATALTNLFDSTLSTTGWTRNTSAYVTLTVTTGTDGYFTYTASATASNNTYAYYAYKDLGSAIGPGTKWNSTISYIEVEVKGKTGNTGTPVLIERYRTTNSTNTQAWSLARGDSSFNDNNWHLLRGITISYDANSNISNTTYGVGIGLLNQVQNDVLYFRNIKVINLTSIFGAGNEPHTIEEFDKKTKRSNGVLYGKVLSGSTIFSNSPSLMKQSYIGINDQPKKIKKIYIGVNNQPKLFYKNITYKELFANVDKFYALGQYVSTAALFPANQSYWAQYPASTYPTNGASGETWYVLYMRGGSLEINRIDLASTTMTKNVLTFREYIHATSQLVQNNAIQTTATECGAFFLYLHFDSSKFTSAEIDEKFLNSKINFVQYYHNSTTTNDRTDSGYGVLSTNCSFSSGILLAAFARSEKYCYWGAVDAATPTGNMIKGGAGATTFASTSYPILATYRYNTQTSYYYPVYNGSSTASTYGYTLLHFDD